LNDIETEPEKVQLILYLDFSDESEKAIETAWEVAEEMLDENIWVEVEPIHLWNHDPLGIEIADYPKIIINGKTMFIGRAPSKKELIEAIRDRVGKPLSRSREEESILVRNGGDGFREIVLTA